MLTRNAKAALNFIIDFQNENGGVSPTLAEIAVGIGMSPHSKAGATRLLDDLERAGAIQRLRNRCRAIQVVRKPIPIYRAEDNQLMGYLP